LSRYACVDAPSSPHAAREENSSSLVLSNDLALGSSDFAFSPAASAVQNLLGLWRCSTGDGPGEWPDPEAAAEPSPNNCRVVVPPGGCIRAGIPGWGGR
jgi:hypothetical protein